MRAEGIPVVLSTHRFLWLLSFVGKDVCIPALNGVRVISSGMVSLIPGGCHRRYRRYPAAAERLPSDCRATAERLAGFMERLSRAGFIILVSALVWDRGRG